MANFQRDSLGWQWGKGRRHLGEWLEVVTREREGSGDNFTIPDWLPPLLNFLAWLVLILCSAWLGLMIYRFGRNYWLERQGLNPALGIPLEPDRALADLLRDAQKSYEQRDYGAACRYLYLGLLQYLHSRDILPQKISRTDGEYRRSLPTKSPFPLAECYTLINFHERFYFSELVVGEQDFVNCKTALDRIVNQP